MAKAKKPASKSKNKPKIRELEALRKELRRLLRRKADQSTANAVCPIIEHGAAKAMSKAVRS